jgi:hypothetical protein
MSENKKRYEIDLISYNDGPVESIYTSLEIPLGIVIETTKGNFKILRKGILSGFYQVEPVESVT